MNTKTLFSGIVIITSLTFSSCVKDGPVGPQGPAGADGANGTNGNANVLGSTTLSVTSADWTANGNEWYETFILGTITQDIVDKGAVMVYEQYNSSWTALPYTLGITGRSFDFYVGGGHIYSSNTNGTASTNPGNQTYRFVVISASNRMAHPTVNYKNYAEVKKAFNLKD